jgi:pimeloyl-ACP methyl ester carboxylesterase
MIRSLLALLALALFATACATISPDDDRPPIVFVHGNGDTAALWHTTVWRFESNGWDRRRLHAIDFRYPLARSDDAKPQANRSSSAEQREQLAAKVAEVLRSTGRDRLVLIGSSRGGNTIRDYVKNGGGSAYVSHVILAGAINHGTSDWEETRGSELNAKSAFLTQLNAGPEEVVPGVRFMTIRSDTNDKYAHPDGRFLGSPGKPTNVGYDGPELKGAENVVIPRIDHRETAFHPLAFAQMFRFVTGQPPARLDIAPEREVILNGKVNGVESGVQTNLPVAGARVEIYKVNPATGERIGSAARTVTTATDGLWGPFRTIAGTYYEFVVEAPGHAVTHIYRSPFPRSSDIIHLRPADLTANERTAGSVVVISRPRGYFGHGRDTFLLDGKVPAGINEGVPGTSTGRMVLDAGPMRAIPTRFNSELITIRNWPARDGHIAIAEFHY